MKKTLLAAAAAAAFAPLAAQATDGYFQHGYGMKSKGRGGASTAMTTDAFGGAVNPATMAFVGERLDVGLDWFRPDRSAKREGSARRFARKKRGQRNRVSLICRQGKIAGDSH